MPYDIAKFCPSFGENDFFYIKASMYTLAVNAVFLAFSNFQEFFFKFGGSFLFLLGLRKLFTDGILDFQNS